VLLPWQARRVSRLATVIMKTFHRPETAALAASRVRRYYPEIRLLVADDGREDLAFRHPQAETLRLPFDCGVSKGRNALLERVETGFFVLMDDDHFMSRHTRLDRMLAILERERLDILACHVYRRKRHTDRLFPKRKLDDFFRDFSLEAGTLTMRQAQGPVTRGYRVCDVVENFFVARTERVRAIGGWDERLKLVEHVDFFMRAKQAGLRVGYTARSGVDHVHIQRERAAADYRHYRVDHLATYRRIWTGIHGIERVVEPDGSSFSVEELCRRGP
jgi:GT2 family glycosyltransferase